MICQFSFFKLLQIFLHFFAKYGQIFLKIRTNFVHISQIWTEGLKYGLSILNMDRGSEIWTVHIKYGQRSEILTVHIKYGQRSEILTVHIKCGQMATLFLLTLSTLLIDLQMLHNIIFIIQLIICPTG